MNWRFAMEKIQEARRSPEDPVRVLNLFGLHRGGHPGLHEAGAVVTHVDASKGMVQWLRRTPGQLSGGEPVRCWWMTA